MGGDCVSGDASHHLLIVRPCSPLALLCPRGTGLHLEEAAKIAWRLDHLTNDTAAR